MLKNGDKIYLYEIKKKKQFENIKLDQDIDSLLDYGFGMNGYNIERKINHEEHYFDFYNLTEFTIDTIFYGRVVLKELSSWFLVWQLRDKFGNHIITSDEEYKKYVDNIIR